MIVSRCIDMRRCHGDGFFSNPPRNSYLVGGFQPISKIVVKLARIPQLGVKIKIFQSTLPNLAISASKVWQGAFKYFDFESTTQILMALTPLLP